MNQTCREKTGRSFQLVEKEIGEGKMLFTVAYGICTVNNNFPRHNIFAAFGIDKGLLSTV